MIKLIVFLPLLAAIVAGLGNRAIGNFAAKLVTTGSLFVGCVLSWPLFLGFLSGSEQAFVEPVLTFIRSGDLAVDWSLRVDTLTAVMLVVVTTTSITAVSGSTRRLQSTTMSPDRMKVRTGST